MNYLEHEIVEVVLPLFMATTMLWMWDRMILPKSLVGAHLTRQLELLPGTWAVVSFWVVKPVLGEGMGSPDAGVRGAFPRWLWQGSNAKHDLVVCHLQEWTPSFFSANTGSEHFRTTSPTESHHWDFMKYFSSCLIEWTTILPIDKHMEFSQDIDISNSISSYLMRERYIYSEGNVSRYFTG